MMTLYDNAFSPFARKVRMVLEHKRLAFEAIDGLAPAVHAKLAAVNPRNNLAHCFSCQKNLNNIDLLLELG